MQEKIRFNKKNIVYDINYAKNKWDNWIKNEELYKVKNEYAKRNYFFNLKPGEKVLEYGCGIGQNISWIKDAYGYDINKDLYPLLESKGVKMYDKTEDIPDNFFDYIITCMVLEHVPDPIQTINILKRKLKKDGFLITVLPCLSYSLNKRTSIKDPLNTTIDGHLFGWTFYEINYLLNYCGFKNIVNKFIYRRGIDRFYKLNKYGLYFTIIHFLGYIMNERDILIISKKE